jgi:hypothetical protein
MLRNSWAMGVIAAGIWIVLGWSASAEDVTDASALAKALSEARITLDQGLKASEREGKPISGEYGLEDGALQLSIFVMKGDKFAEVIVDHKTGSITEAEPLTDPDDLKDAKKQGEAMGKAKHSLEEAIRDAVNANSGYRAVSVTPMLRGDQPEASISLLRGEETKEVTEKLN